MTGDYRRRGLSLLAAWLLAGGAVAATSPLERGNQAWARRAEGFAERGRPDPGPARAALAAYEEAVAADPESVALHFRCLEARYFLAHFATEEKKVQRRLYERQIEETEVMLRMLESRHGGPEAFRNLSLSQRAARLRTDSDAAPAHFWAAISWGLWGMSHGYFASARRGVAEKIRDHATLVTMLDERFADGGGFRLLGRLHTATPRVPLVTSWIDRKKGLALLRRAHSISARDPRNPLFLAEALLRHTRQERPQALVLLREVARRRPDPAFLVEESETIAEARRLLRAEGESR